MTANARTKMQPPKDCARCSVALPRMRHYKTYLCDGCKADRGGEKMGFEAQSMVGYAIRLGYLPHISSCICADCGAPATDYDHRDYNKPLEVDAVCRSCNFKRGPAKLFTSVLEKQAAA